MADLDHFKLYDVQPISAVGHEPYLAGQFDNTAQAVKLGFLQHFANPVSKNGEGILDPNAHLTVYEIQTQVAEPTRTVILENQFGEQKLAIDHAIFLLAPAHKKQPGISLSANLDHFKCYRVAQGDPIGQDVSLKDQFDSEDQVLVDKPLFFCVPVEKRYGGQLHKIKNPKWHLTIYSIPSKDYQLSIDVEDQFLKDKLNVVRSHALAVPSSKLDWK